MECMKKKEEGDSENRRNNNNNNNNMGTVPLNSRPTTPFSSQEMQLTEIKRDDMV
jgi:hypothetical protein